MPTCLPAGCTLCHHLNNNNLLHLYSTFLGTQSTLYSKGISPHPPPVCSVHLDERPPHTSLLVERRQSEEAN